jgi:hypothetical protein
VSVPTSRMSCYGFVGTFDDLLKNGFVCDCVCTK